MLLKHLKKWLNGEEKYNFSSMEIECIKRGYLGTAACCYRDRMGITFEAAIKLVKEYAKSKI